MSDTLKNEFMPPHEDERPDGLEMLAFHRGKWRHVMWSITHRGWHLGYGGPFIRDGDRSWAPLPQKPADAPGFYDFKE